MNGEGIMGDNAKTYTELGLKHGSKRGRNPEEHKRAKTKRLKNETKKNNFVELIDAYKCHTKNEELSDDVRKQFRTEYYDLEVNRRRDMILKFVVKSVEGRCSTDNEVTRREGK